jgi:hypothetical protein
MTSPLEKKLKIAGPSVVTANRTRDGIVIWRTAKGWSERLSDAAVVDDAETARALLDDAVADDLGAIGSYIAPVKIARDGAIEPGNLREHIRRDGATIELPVEA